MEALLGRARVRGSVIHDPATRSERAGVSRDGRHVGRAIARRSTLRARRRVSASLSVEPATWGTSASEKRRQDVVRPDRDGRLQKTVRIPATASTRVSGSRRRDRRDWGVSDGTTMAGPLMRMPNGQMIVSFDARSPKIHQNAPPPQPTISRPALFQPRSRLTAVAPLPPPTLLPPTATPDRAPARGHGHEPGQGPAHLQHQRLHGGRGFRPHHPGTSQIRLPRSDFEKKNPEPPRIFLIGNRPRSPLTAIPPFLPRATNPGPPRTG